MIGLALLLNQDVNLFKYLQWKKIEILISFVPRDSEIVSRLTTFQQIKLTALSTLFEILHQIQFWNVLQLQYKC